MFKKTKNSAKMVLGSLMLVLALMVGGVTLSYWASGVTGNNDDATGTINIGTAKTATTVVSVADYLAENQYLVPVDRADDSNEAEAVESVTLTFNVAWTSELSNTATGTNGTLTVTLGDVLIDGSATYKDLVVIAGVAGYQDAAIVVDGDEVVVTLTVTLTEPETKTVYDAVAGKDITIALNFAVEVA